MKPSSFLKKVKLPLGIGIWDQKPKFRGPRRLAGIGVWGCEMSVLEVGTAAALCWEHMKTNSWNVLGTPSSLSCHEGLAENTLFAEGKIWKSYSAFFPWGNRLCLSFQQSSVQLPELVAFRKCHMWASSRGSSQQKQGLWIPRWGLVCKGLVHWQ